MKLQASDYKSIWYQVQESYIIHKNMLEEANLHHKFIIKTCLVHPQFYHDMMQDEAAKTYTQFQLPITELTLYGIPLKITTEVKSISWIIDFED